MATRSTSVRHADTNGINIYRWMCKFDDEVQKKITKVVKKLRKSVNYGGDIETNMYLCIDKINYYAYVKIHKLTIYVDMSKDPVWLEIDRW